MRDAEEGWEGGSHAPVDGGGRGGREVVNSRQRGRGGGRARMVSNARSLWVDVLRRVKLGYQG